MENTSPEYKTPYPPGSMGGAIVCEGIDDAGNPVNPVFDFALSVRGAKARDEFERVWAELDAAREAAEYAARVLNAYKV